MSQQTEPMMESSDTGAREVTEYIIVSDTNSKIILSTNDYKNAVGTMSMIRRAGGQVTLFKSLRS